MDRRSFVRAGLAGAGMAGLGAGFDPESLAASTATPDGPLSAGSDGDVVIVKDVPVPMRDGLDLMTDLYLPAVDGVPLEEPLPAVLARTPYDKMRPISIDHAMFFARNGYVSVVQDCRGRFNSGGDFFPFVQEPEDGYDTVEWVARHPSCDGQVGTYGVSYQAWVQFETATLNPPGLKTMIPYEGPTNAYTYSMKCGGALGLGLLQWILSVASNGNEARANPQITEAIDEMRTGQTFLEWASRIPWRRGETPLSLAPTYEEAAFQLYFENYDYSDFWRQPGLGMDEHFESYPDMPILWVVGWFDWYPRTISDGYQAMVDMGRENQHILIGPWTHNNFASSIGEVNFGTEGARIVTYDDYLNLELRWFDRWLKGDESADVWAPAKYFIMGGGDGRRAENGRINQGGAWRYEESWPPAEARPTEFYLHEGGSLAPEVPSARSASTTYTYDPRNTVSSNGPLHRGLRPGARVRVPGDGPARPDRDGDAARPRDPRHADRVPPGRARLPDGSAPGRGDDRRRHHGGPLHFIRRPGHRLLREAPRRAPDEPGLSERLRVPGLRGDPAGALSGGVRAVCADGGRGGLPARVPARTLGEPVQGGAPGPRRCLQQQFPELRYQPEHRGSARPPVAHREQHGPPRGRKRLARPAAPDGLALRNRDVGDP